MSDKMYVLPPPDAVTISAEAAMKLIASKNAEAALLYIYILKNAGELSISEAADTLGLGGKVHDAMKTLRSLGLVSDEERKLIEREDKSPSYTAEDVERSIDSGSSFGLLVKELQNVLGSVLSGNDLISFFGMYDYLGLPAEVILILTVFCTERAKKRYGEGRKPTVRSIEKEAYIWARNEVFTLDAAEEYISKQGQRSGVKEEMKSALQIKKRALSPTEDKYINSWIDMGMSPDAVELAYDRTLINTGELKWAYLNSILKSWHSMGFKTAKEAEAGDAKKTPIRSKAKEKNEPATPDAGELERMKKYLDKLKSDE